jgi:hypothetical protein
MNDKSGFVLGLGFILIGIIITAKTWNVTLEELIRARIWGAGWGARLKWIGLALMAVGIVTVLASLGMVRN